MPVTKSGPGFERLKAVLTGIDGVQVRVGWFEGTTEPNGTPTAYVAAIHEFGAPRAGIPARPFMRPTIANNQAAWMQEFAAIARKSLMGGLDPVQAMDQMGLRIAGEVKQSIQAVSSPPLKPQTVKRKGHNKPLVESGTMLKTVVHKTEKTKW